MGILEVLPPPADAAGSQAARHVARLCLSNPGWGWLHLVWSRDDAATAGGVVAIGPGAATELLVPESPPEGPPRRILLKSRTGPREERWRIPPPSIRAVPWPEEEACGDEAPPAPAEEALPAPRGAEPPPLPPPAGDCLVIFCEPDRWDAWAVLPTVRLVRRLGGGNVAVASQADLDAAVQESQRLFRAWRGSSQTVPAPLVIPADARPLAAAGSLPALAGARVRTKAGLVLQGWRMRRVPGPEEAFVAVLEVGLEHITLRILDRSGSVAQERASQAFSTRARSAVVQGMVDDCPAPAGPDRPAREEWLTRVPLDVLQHPDERSDVDLPASLPAGTTARSLPRAPLRRALLSALDEAVASLMAPPLPQADPILAFGAALDLEAVRRHLTGRFLRLCPDRAQPLCCLGLLATATREPHLELEAIEGRDQVSRMDLPFQLSPGPDRVDLTYELPAGRALTLRLFEREGTRRRLLGEATVPPPRHDAILVLLVRETARGRLSVDLHDGARGCREIMEVPAPTPPR